jgi:hypothetical protein
MISEVRGELAQNANEVEASGAEGVVLDRGVH